MTPVASKIDRAALVRRAMVELVAESGLHGASMAAIAQRAGVGTGTAYVHYESKDRLLLAAYQEQKSLLDGAAVARLDPDDSPKQQFQSIWSGVYRHLAADPVVARFLIQVDASPYAEELHQVAIADRDDQLRKAAEALMDVFVGLPPEVLNDLALGPAVRLAASGQVLDPGRLNLLAEACWRAVTED